MVKEVEQISIVLRVCLAVCWAASSAALTFVNRLLYAEYNYKSPLCLLFLQCLFNVSICLVLMSYKQYVSPKAFEFLVPYGIKISSLGEAAAKMQAGLIISSTKIVEVMLGLYSLKAVNIPLFLTFRRASILCTIIVTFLWKREGPSRTLMLASAFVVSGAVVAGYDTFDNNAFGYMLIIGNNFASSFVNVIASVYNEKKVVTAFDLNLFFALIGLPLTLLITIQTGELTSLMEVFFGSPEKQYQVDYSMIFYMLISGSFGIVITITSLLCVTINGPISMNIGGIFKDVGLTYAGFVFFSDASATISQVVGMGLSFSGAAYFCHSKYQDSLR